MDQGKPLRPQIWLLLSLLAAGTASIYVSRVLGPWERFMDQKSGALTSTLGDLYPRWAGTRALLLDHRNPYGPEVSHEIQTAYYGHPIVQNYDAPGLRIVDEQRFAYPVYVAFLMAPVAHLSYPTLHSWLPWFLMVLVAASVWLWLEVLQWRPGTIIVAALIFFVLASSQIVQGLNLRQLGLFVAFLLALGTWSVARNYLVTGGAVLALATIKPQMTVLPIAWFVIWAVGDLPKRWRLLAGFAGTMAVLAGAGEWMLPGWIGDFLRGLAAYRKYVVSPPLLEAALGKTLGLTVAAIVVAGVLARAWMNRKAAAGSAEFAGRLAIVLMGAALAMPLLAPFNQVLLILPVLMIVRDWSSLPKISRFAFLAFTSFPWLVEIVLLISPPDVNSVGRQPSLPSILILLMPFLIPLLLATRRSQISSRAPAIN